VSRPVKMTASDPNADSLRGC